MGSYTQTIVSGTDLAGSIPTFPSIPGDTLIDSLELPDFQQKRLLFNRLERRGQIHIYRAQVPAGSRIRIRMYVPIVQKGRAVIPSFGIIAQSLPYSADTQRLPLELPAGYSAVAMPAPSKLTTPITDTLTRVQYYTGPLIDTRTLVGGQCYIVVWSPKNELGKYVLQVGHRWSLRWSYWIQIPWIWWQIRTWFGLSRMAAYAVAAGICILLFIFALLSKKRRNRNQ